MKPTAKKLYVKPQLKKHGLLRQLTLKMGSSSDTFGRRGNLTGSQAGKRLNSFPAFLFYRLALLHFLTRYPNT